MNILVTLDKKYLYPLTVMLKSLTKSNPHGCFEIYVAHTDLDNRDFRHISDCVDTERMRINPVQMHPELFKDAPLLKRTTYATYYRLIAFDYLPDTVDKILYLDPDICIINNLSSLYELDISEYSLAAAGHTYGWCELLNKLRFPFADGERYINAGVMLMNLKMMREKYSRDDIFDYIRRNKRHIYVGDQDVINGLYAGSMKIVDEMIYNLDEKTYRRFNRIINPYWIRNNTVIIHYNGKYKPWNPGYKGKLAQFFYEAENIQIGEVYAEK